MRGPLPGSALARDLPADDRIAEDRVEPLEETCLIKARGELDRSTADRLTSALDAARADGVTTLLDLSAVSFIDTAGLRVLLCSGRAFDGHD